MPRPFLPNPHFTEGSIPAHLKLVVKHLHPANSTKKQRRKKSYATIAWLYHRETKELVAEGHSYCSNVEPPSRKQGRMVAVGRALKEYYNPVPF